MVNLYLLLDLPKYRQQKGKYKNYPFRFWAGNKLLGGYSDHLAIRAATNDTPASLSFWKPGQR